MSDDKSPPAQREEQLAAHQWAEPNDVVKWPHCSACGVIKQRDGSNESRPCKGKGRIELRCAEPAQEAKKEADAGDRTVAFRECEHGRFSTRICEICHSIKPLEDTIAALQRQVAEAVKVRNEAILENNTQRYRAEAAESERNAKDKQLAECYDRMNRAESELQAVRMDAERYAYLVGGCRYAETDSAWDTKESLDAAIDADMAIERKGQ